RCRRDFRRRQTEPRMIAAGRWRRNRFRFGRCRSARLCALCGAARRQSSRNTMALTQARTMPGVMELLPLDQIALQNMLDTIRANFERFGFLPIETPVMEFSDVLLTKQGGETERQVYFVQSTGTLEQGGKPELALRFDLTVPLARYVAEHEHDLSFP